MLGKRRPDARSCPHPRLAGNPLADHFQADGRRGLIWLWLTLVSTVLVVIVAVLLAITLNPVVEWFEARGLPRWAASVVVALPCSPQWAASCG